MPEAKETQMFQEGALVVLSIGAKSWSTQLKPSDLGLTEWPANFKPGRKMLLPEEAIAKLSTIEGQSRRYLESRSFQYGKKQARMKFRFVRIEKLYDTIVTLESYRDKYFEEVKKLISDYEALKDRMKADFPDQWPALSKLYPPVDAIEREYYFIIEPSEMTFPNSFSLMKRFELEKMKRTLEEAEKAKADNLEELRRQQAASRARLERMEQEKRREAEARVEEFVEESIRSLRSHVVKVFAEITEKIKDKKKLIKPNVDAMKEAIAYVKEMDFLNDAAFHQQLDQVKAVLDANEDFKDDARATSALDNALNDTIAFVQKTTAEATAAAKKTYFARKLAI